MREMRWHSSWIFSTFFFSSLLLIFDDASLEKKRIRRRDNDKIKHLSKVR